MFCLPPILAGRIAPSLGVEAGARLVGLVTVLAMAWAAVAGTWIGAKLLPGARLSRPPSMPTRAAFGILLALLAAANAYTFGALGLSLSRKSQILKCHYSVDWSSFGLERPRPTDFLGKRARVGVHFDVRIENPTGRDVVLEKNRLVVRHQGKDVAEGALTPVAVPAGGETRQRMDLTFEVDPRRLLDGKALLDRSTWSITLYLDVAPGFELPVYLAGD